MRHALIPFAVGLLFAAHARAADPEWIWLAAPKASDGWRNVGFDDSQWRPAYSVAKLGGGPWGNIFQGAPAIAGKGTATPAESLTVLPGFKAELLYSVPRGEQGSWVNM